MQHGGSAEDTSLEFVNPEGHEDSDKVYSGGGADYIDAAAFDVPDEFITPPVDSSYGQRGNDHIYAVDGNEDMIDCGRGRDAVLYDVGLDTINNCERDFC